MKKDALIDMAAVWINKRGAAYLAKENTIVYYTSHTGRSSDFVWCSLTLPEVIRIITATQMGPDDAGKLRQEHIMAACQEWGRVFEFGVKTRHKVKSGIFNYLDQADQDMGDDIVSLVSEELYARGYFAMLRANVSDVIFSVCNLLNHTLSLREVNELIHKHFPLLGYEVRTGPSRPQVNNRKQSAIMLPGTFARNVLVLTEDVVKEVSVKVHGALR